MGAVNRVAIVGAGPLGLGFAKAIAQEPHAKKIFDKIDVFERRPQAGGLWNHTGDKSDVTIALSESIENPKILKVTDNDPHLSPMYKHTETNIIKQLMRYKDYPLPEKSNTFPTRNEVLDYIVDYQKTIPKDLVNFKFNSKVNSLEKTGNEWELKSNGATYHYDNVILAHGHFDSPFIPKTKGLLNWFHNDPTSISHAKYFNDVSKYKNQKVLVIGNSASGIDISTQLLTVSKSVVMSCIGEPMFKGVIESETEQVDCIKEFDYQNNKSVVTASGKVIDNIDKILYCTGYLYTLPFLKSYTHDGELGLENGGTNIRNIYKQLFYINDPSLILAGLPKSIIPFPFAEAQAQYVARILSGRLSLPSKEDMLKDYQQELKVRGSGSSFHVLDDLQDVDYCNEMYDLIRGTEKDGFVADYWGDDLRNLRVATGESKRNRFFTLVDYANKLKAEGLEWHSPPQVKA